MKTIFIGIGIFLGTLFLWALYVELYNSHWPWKLKDSLRNKKNAIIRNRRLRQIEKLESRKKFKKKLKKIFPDGFTRQTKPCQAVKDIIDYVPEKCWKSEVDGRGILFGTAYWQGPSKPHDREMDITISIFQEGELQYAYITYINKDLMYSFVHREAKVLI